MKLVAMIGVALLALSSAGCKVCGFGACAKDQGTAVAAVVPQLDGTILVTTCKLVTEGTGAKLRDCAPTPLPAPGAANGSTQTTRETPAVSQSTR